MKFGEEVKLFLRILFFNEGLFSFNVSQDIVLEDNGCYPDGVVKACEGWCLV
jgi:hypothetical protein